MVSTLFLGWYDVATSHNVKSTLKQRCVRQRWTTSNQRCTFQRWFEQRRNNVVIFNLDFHNVGQRWNNVVNMKIWKKKKKLSLDSKVKWYFWASNNTLDSKCSSFYCPFSEEYVKEDLQGRKILKTWNILNYKNYKPSHFVKYQLVFNLTRRQVQTS